jgi:hypothetical protein
MPTPESTLNRIFEDRMRNLHTSMPAKILTIEEGEAMVQPLAKDKDGEQLPIMNAVPWVKHRFEVNGRIQVYNPIYQKGDIVLIVFSESPLNGEYSHMHHDLNQGVIIGLL